MRDAIETELARGGQVYFVHNRVEDLPMLQGMVTRLCPKARVGVGHGKMPPSSSRNSSWTSSTGSSTC